MRSENAGETIEIADYWKSQVKEEKRNNAAVYNFLMEYQQYIFTPLMLGTQKALVNFAARSLTNIPDPDMRKVEIIFDLLLSLKDYSGAIVFLTTLTNQYSGNYSSCPSGVFR